jgi:hypothetical protein
MKKEEEKRGGRGNRVNPKTSNPGSIQLSLSQAKADPSITLARINQFL